ncbi:class I SAM-dependent methyltransferase [Marinactinospora thermotolerans]|uniref:Methylase involved in ubiquinone/menaquinone biosynthesis n=1 Tax=Marinactinospora thermotolerans DSM 45154 TaxID=1122192 RepID=A0A1T4M8T6_9ACTN|nr:methyltransferase domain-containing protein [Marinactinospora thermotolerans]SJZ63114.1 Methylase involved in ubiquinone/menaquinone biosynthesis [Marinactinospora thermotolerans DSM 45154]
MTHRDLWTGQPPGSNPFALPRGLPGFLAGVVLAWTNRAQNIEIANSLGVRPGDHVLEIGTGPGVLVQALARSPEVTVTGIDPSPEMVRMALRRNAAAVRRGRVRLYRADAAHTGVASGDVDVVVSVNTVAMWPDLDAGVGELHRVLRPGGRAVLAWHHSDTRLALSDTQLDRVEAALRDRFGGARRGELRMGLIFAATKRGRA